VSILTSIPKVVAYARTFFYFRKDSKEQSETMFLSHYWNETLNEIIKKPICI